MVRITVDLIRKRSEHNEGEISTLEELTLHQEDIEKIDNLQNWCRELRILLLQSNLISKIENLNKMKRLEYLNLALNNVERIENLERCESLEKLDLTLNFIGELTSVSNLKKNSHLKILYLTGNPCTEYDGYREYVIATLPQLETLDSQQILRSDQIKALQHYDEISEMIIAQQIQYKVRRDVQKKENYEKIQKKAALQELHDPEETKQFWDEMCDNSPETRVELANVNRKQKDLERRKQVGQEDVPTKRSIKLFKDDGSPLNANEARIPFTLTENEESNELVLTVEVYRHLDTTLVEVDVQPTYVKVVVKGKVLQIVLPEAVHPDKCCAQRSQTTGYLAIKMPRVKERRVIKTKINDSQTVSQLHKSMASITSSKREFLEIGRADISMDFSRIVDMTPKSTHKACLLGETHISLPSEKPVSKSFIENPEVPPLE